jgi:predicted nuclease of predicted toxin-antitoxin system
MLRFLCDESFDGRLVEALRRVHPPLDLIRVQDVGLRGADDPSVLAWAAANDRILLTQDKRTMPGHAEQRLLAGEPMPGVFVVNNRASFTDVIEDIVLLNECSDQTEWVGRIERIPFRR